MFDNLRNQEHNFLEIEDPLINVNESLSFDNNK